MLDFEACRAVTDRLYGRHDCLYNRVTDRQTRRLIDLVFHQLTSEVTRLICLQHRRFRRENWSSDAGAFSANDGSVAPVNWSVADEHGVVKVIKLQLKTRLDPITPGQHFCV
ncbi:hypothetical protein J6590_055190 [Homalodisca vitripennis]|nr:hypothetical protein J6590_055190 [Homalodisca vitripennis]